MQSLHGLWGSSLATEGQVQGRCRAVGTSHFSKGPKRHLPRRIRSQAFLCRLLRGQEPMRYAVLSPWLLAQPQEGTASVHPRQECALGRFSVNGMWGWCHYIWFCFPLVVEEQRFQLLSTSSDSLRFYQNSGTELGVAAVDHLISLLY